jgi:flavin prenyltransferase
MANKLKIIVSITGSSGSIYAKQFIEKLDLYRSKFEDIALVFSTNAISIWQEELGPFSPGDLPFRSYDRKDFTAPFASGSAKWDALVVCPCSMGTLGRIANGISDDLITRTADVILKERRKLILVTREAPLNLIHIENMKKITLAGGIICPASPSFYSKPKSIEEVVNTVIDRIFDLLDIENKTFRWNS